MKWIFPIAILCLSACGESPANNGEDFGNLLDTPSGLVLTEGEHPDGWGRPSCISCHNLDNIHIVNRTGTPLDINAIHDQALAQGISGCAVCHGTNGVP